MGSPQNISRRNIVPRLVDLDFSKPYYGPALVSAEEAAALLAKFNLDNRRPRKNLVYYLQKQIENDEWQDDHPQPIVFSSRRLIDGQHRLFGVAGSGREVCVMVLTGARDDLREYIDTGISRQLEDRVTFSDDPVENKIVAQIINAAFCDMRTDANINHRDRRPTPVEATDFFELHRDAILWVSQYKRRKVPRVTAMGVLSALFQMYERDQDKAEEFAESLFSPDGTIQQARRLREYCIGTAVTGGGTSRRQLYLKAVGAMKAYIEDREIKALRSASSW